MSADVDQFNPTPFSTEPEASTPEFRVVSRGKERRGIRLEKIFWQSAKEIARRNGTTMGAFVEEVSRNKKTSANLASAIRVACLSSTMERANKLEALTSATMVNALLAAVPSPGFALAANKKILAFNAAFQTLVRRQFPILAEMDQRVDLKLALDVNVADLTARLDGNGNVAVLTGFAVGVGDRRFRGQLNAVKAPSGNSDIILAFVIG